MINANDNLVLIKNEDKTENIDTWSYRDGYYFITFCGGSGKAYKYHYLNVAFYKNPRVVDLSDTMILKNGAALYAVKQVLTFKHHSKIIYENGYKETVKNRALSFNRSALSAPKSRNCFEYLKQVAITIGLKGDDGKNILANRYEKIDFVREDSVLASYLSGKLRTTVTKKNQIVYPVGFNLSQKQAVENAMSNTLSVIEGPPGTGKTQTILNIIGNALMNGESVAVVSSNNSATQNVLDKLNKNGIGFIAAYLGNGENKTDFIENQKPELPHLEGWHLESDEYMQINNDLIAMSEQLDKMLEVRNKLSKLMQEREVVRTEYEHYMDYYNETNSNHSENFIKEGTKSDRILNLLVSLENEEKTKSSIWGFIYYLIKYGIRKRNFFKTTQDRQIAICQKYFYEVKLQELDTDIGSLEGNLKGYDFDEKMKSYSDKSLQLLKSNIAQRYEGQTERTIYDADDLWKKSEQFVMDYPIILSTTYSLRSSLSSQFVYDYVIVDEASQVDLATGALVLSCAKKAVVVGDLKQLPNVVKNEMKQSIDQIFDRFSLEEAYRYSNHSLLSSISELFNDLPHTLLREHYRCHPKIIEFCNQKFYQNELIILTKNTTEKAPLMVYKTVKGNHKRDKVNIRQVDVIEKEVIPEQTLDTTKDSIGIVTPYRNQTEYLQKVFKGTTVKADTVDKFQGQECDTIILSTVDDEISNFADDPNRLNVAISRAIKQLIIVTDGNESRKQSNLNDLIEYIEYNNFAVIDSKIYSIFDYLYQSYNEIRINYLKDKKRIAEFDSENLMYSLMQDVLKSNELFDKCDIAVHVPLRMIIRDLANLEEEAIRYVMAPGTHVDFVIYSKISKKLILVVEVDGYRFHKEGTKQAERDKMKNTILDTYEIPYVRFKTNGSGEKEVITNKLLELLE